MILTKESLLYDISNMAYLIADTGEESRHTLHRLRDICEDGNIDRVSRLLGLAYTKVIDILAPLICHVRINPERDFSSSVKNYEIKFLAGSETPSRFTLEKQLEIKETVREYMVTSVLAHWLEVTLPECAAVWKQRNLEAANSLESLVNSVMTASSLGFRRKISPF